VRRLVALVLAAWLVAAIALFVVHHDDRPARADAVVVLAGSRFRLPVGIRLVREGYAPLLVVSRSHTGALERRVCAGRLRLRVLCVDAKPSSTGGEARAIGRLARSRRWRRIDVVTSQFHVFRARMLIRRCYHGGLRMVGAKQPEWKLPWYMVTESAKLAWQLTVDRAC
jgi:uncharacterized SAM-binding protein YcdF (DUF218 family)